MRKPFSYRYLSLLDAPISSAQRTRVERVLAGARAALAGIATIALLIDPPEPERYAELTYLFLAAWMVYSFILILAFRKRQASAGVLPYLQAVDILWPALLTALTHGPSSPFFALFSFALVAASFRWGFNEAIVVVAVGTLFLGIEALTFSGSTAPYYRLVEGEFEINRLILHYSFLVTLGYLIGKLGENEKERRAETAVVSRVLRAPQKNPNFAAMLQTVLAEFLRISKAEAAYLVSHDLNTDQVHVWQMAGRTPRERMPHPVLISPDQRSAYLLEDSPASFFCERSRGGARVYSLTGKTVERTRVQDLPQLCFHPEGATSVVACTATIRQDWRLRLVLVNADLGPRPSRILEFLQYLFEQSASSLHRVYLIRRLRTRAGALERARVARELHDGTIQSLISAEMRVDILRRRAERDLPAWSADLQRIQELLREEVLNLRELMLRMKPVEIGPDQLLEHMAERVDRFRRDTGISARFVCSEDEVMLTPHTCREILLVLQEALTNIRRHAKATEALVSFSRQNGFWKLNVIDNGKGFGFAGTLGGEELARSAKGPAVIKERVAQMGGELTIESSPGEGSRVQIRLPQKGYGFHGE